MGTTSLFLIPTMIWGSTWLAITYQLGVVPPEVSVAYRFGLASLILAGWCLASRRSLEFSHRDHAFLAAQGVLFYGFNYIGVYWAERHVASGLVAVVFATIVFLNPIAMRLAYNTPVTARTLVAATLGVGGVALLFFPEITSAGHAGSAAYGIAFALGATVLACGGNLIAVRNHGAGIPILAGNAWAMGYGALSATIAAIVQGLTWSFDSRPAYIFSLAYLAVFGSVIAFGAYLTLLKRVGAGPAAYVGVSTPVIALVLSTFVEGYRWTWVAALGVVLAILGNWLALRPTTAAIPEDAPNRP